LSLLQLHPLFELFHQCRLVVCTVVAIQILSLSLKLVGARVDLVSLAQRKKGLP